MTQRLRMLCTCTHSEIQQLSMSCNLPLCKVCNAMLPLRFVLGSTSAGESGKVSPMQQLANMERGPMHSARIAKRVVVSSYSADSSKRAYRSVLLAPPATVADLVDSQWAGKIASSYPNDDDAVLYLYTRYVAQYGWDWVAKLANQSVAFHRGSNVAGDLVRAGEKVIGMGTDVGVNVVGGNNTEYIAWGQRAAILAKAKHPAAAKLFMNWALSNDVQSTTVAPSVRTDINTDKPWDSEERPTWLALRRSWRTARTWRR
ncbi:unnamed protein product [Phytophthora lilii]|uniref:Unnamed protein product n=1 Tax=Phytophthora lilii TaxID=2077276 RepID=A0A9W6WVA0_9STRA|nr:unnamed protein product [Phytophthora lilii]